MGWDYVTYHGHLEQFRDSDLWLLRHFFLAEARADAALDSHADADAICQYFERWNWIGPGVMMGTELDGVVEHSRERWQRLMRVLSRSRDRVLSFGSHIPLEYMEMHYNTPVEFCTKAQPTDRYVQAIDRLIALLAKWEPGG